MHPEPSKAFLKSLIPKLLPVLLAMEAALFAYYEIVDIPKSLQEEFDQMEAQEAGVNAELHALDAFREEHIYAYEALAAMLAVKPAAIRFGALNFGSGTWLRFELMSPQASEIDSYIQTLAANDWFRSIHIVSRTRQGGMEIALVEIRRPE